MKKKSVRLCALLVALVLFALSGSAFSFATDGADRMRLIVVTHAPTGAYDMRTLQGVQAYLREHPDAVRYLGNPEAAAACVVSVKTVFEDPDTDSQIAEVILSEEGIQRAPGILHLLEKCEDVTQVEIDQFDGLQAQPSAYASFIDAPSGYFLFFYAFGLRDIANCVFTVTYDPALFTVRRWENSTDYGRLPYFLVTDDLSEPGVVRCTVTAAGMQTINETMDYFHFMTNRAGEAQFTASCRVEYQNGTTELFPIALENAPATVVMPYPAEKGGSICDITLVNQNDSREFCALRNVYFKKNADRLFETSYRLYEQHTRPEILKNPNYKEEFLAQAYQYDENYPYDYFSMLIFDTANKKEDETFADFNQRMLQPLQKNIKEILYVANTVPCAIVLTDSAVYGRYDFLRDDTVEYVEQPFRMTYLDKLSGAGFYPSPVKLFSAAGARQVLRAAAGLSVTPISAENLFPDWYAVDREQLDSERIFYICCDIDRDNKLTSADARRILRMAAKLEERIGVYSADGEYWMLPTAAAALS